MLKWKRKHCESYTKFNAELGDWFYEIHDYGFYEQRAELFITMNGGSYCAPRKFKDLEKAIEKANEFAKNDMSTTL